METLTCTGKVLTPIKSTPQRLNLGNISPGAEDDIRKTIVLERGDGGDIHPVLLPSRRGRPLHVKTELREVEAGARYELDVTLAPPWPAGRFTDVLRIQTGIKESPELNYYVYGTVPPRLTTSPKYILVPPERTEEVTRTARIQWSNNKPAKILEVSTSVPGAKVEIEEDIHGQSVKLTVPAGSQPSAAQHNITIKTDDPNSPVIKLPVAFRGRHGVNRAAPVRLSRRASRASSGLWAPPRGRAAGLAYVRVTTVGCRPGGRRRTRTAVPGWHPGSRAKPRFRRQTARDPRFQARWQADIRSWLRRWPAGRRR